MLYMKKLVIIITLLFLEIHTIYAYKILFDYTKDQTAGNADWIIDRDFPSPLPENPSNERDWDGAFSAFAFDIYTQLHDTVYTLHNAPITYNDPSNPMDLSHFDVFIIPEPQNPFNDREKDAIRRFVAAGGGLLMIADHNMSDRNRSGWDSPRVFNDLGSEELFGIHFNITGDRPNSFTEVSQNIPDRTHVIIDGPNGEVTALSFHAGDGMTLYPSKNPSVKGLIFKSGYSENRGAMFAISTYGRGRVAAIGDSSPIDDGTGDPHDRLYDGWHERGTTHPELLLNTIYWLENRDGGNNHPQNFVIDGSLDSTAHLAFHNGDTYIYTGTNDTVFYCGLKYNPDVTRSYVVISQNPEGEFSTPWARDGYLGKYSFYFKVQNSTQEIEIRDSFQIITNPPFIHYAGTRGFIEFTITKTLLSDSIYLLIAGFSSESGGKIVYATPTIDPGSSPRIYYYIGLKTGKEKRTFRSPSITANIMKSASSLHHQNMQMYDITGRKVPTTLRNLNKSGIFLNPKSHKAVIILR